MVDGAADVPDRGEGKEGGEKELETTKRVYYDSISVSDEDESELLARRELIESRTGDEKAADAEMGIVHSAVATVADGETKEEVAVAFDDNDKGSCVDADGPSVEDTAAAKRAYGDGSLAAGVEPDVTIMNSLEPSQMNCTIGSVSELSRFDSFTLERIAAEQVGLTASWMNLICQLKYPPPTPPPIFILIGQGDLSKEGRVASAMLRSSNNERFRTGERPADTSIHGEERARPFRMQESIRSGVGPEGEDAHAERLMTIQGMFKDAIFRKVNGWEVHCSTHTAPDDSIALRFYPQPCFQGWFWQCCTGSTASGVSASGHGQLGGATNATSTHMFTILFLQC